MTDEIGIKITATDSGTEPGRIERLLDVLAIVHSLLDRNIIDMGDEDTQVDDENLRRDSRESSAG
jgi:hypothetical protein